MSAKDNSDTYRFNEDPFCRDPDCLRCLRQKLRATSVAVFFHTPEGWRLGAFQGEKPSAAAEVEFQFMLKAGVPEALASFESGVILPDEQAIAATFPQAKELFEDSCVIAAKVKGGQDMGVRLAWRDSSDPFTAADLTTIQCKGDCPKGCEPK